MRWPCAQKKYPCPSRFPSAELIPLGLIFLFIFARIGGGNSQFHFVRPARKIHLMKKCKTTNATHGFGGILKQSRQFLLVLAVFPCLLVLTGRLQAQVDTIIVNFVPGTPQSTINNLLNSLNGEEIGYTTPSECRLWKIECTPNNPCFINGIPIFNTVEGGGQLVNNPVIRSGGFDGLVAPPSTIATVLAPPPSLPMTVQQFVGCSSSPIAQAGAPTPQAVIALIDSGVDNTHGYFPSSGFFHSNSTSFIGGSAFSDANGHGTHLAGCIQTMNTLGGGGNINLMNLKVVGANGKGSIWNLIRAVDWANTYNADIINISLSYSGDSIIQTNASKPQPLKFAIDKAAENGILVVAAAGNSSANLDQAPEYPAAFESPNIVSVASDQCSQFFSGFSNFGFSSVDMAAPGQSILSTVPGQNAWAYKTGTSMSTSIVSGAAGILATYMDNPHYIPLKCALLSGVNLKNYPILTRGTLNTPQSLVKLMGNCSNPPTSLKLPTGSGSATSSMTMFPVPFTNKIEVQFQATTQGEAKWWLSDALGKIVATGTQSCYEGQNSFEWQGSDLPTGFYVLQLQLEGRRMVQKLTKQD